MALATVSAPQAPLGPRFRPRSSQPACGFSARRWRVRGHAAQRDRKATRHRLAEGCRGSPERLLHGCRHEAPALPVLVQFTLDSQHGYSFLIGQD